MKPSKQQLEKAKNLFRKEIFLNEGIRHRKKEMKSKGLVLKRNG